MAGRLGLILGCGLSGIAVDFTLGTEADFIAGRISLRQHQQHLKHSGVAGTSALRADHTAIVFGDNYSGRAWSAAAIVGWPVAGKLGWGRAIARMLNINKHGF